MILIMAIEPRAKRTGEMSRSRGVALAPILKVMNGRTIWVGCAFATSLFACFLGGGNNNNNDGGGTDGGTVLPFQADPPAVYVPKVKYILTSLAATDQEVQTVTNDPTTFPGLVQQWMQTPQYKT